MARRRHRNECDGVSTRKRVVGYILSDIRKKVYCIVYNHHSNNKWGAVFDSFIILLVIINMLIIIAETFSGLPGWTFTDLSYLEVFIVIVFTIEYLLRLWTCIYIYPDMPHAMARIKYIFSPMAVIDLMSFLPFYLTLISPLDLTILRMLRVLRLLRILKINRYITALGSIGAVLRKKHHQLVSSMIVVLIMMVMASILMYSIENIAQPDKFINAFSGLWWAISTVTTVGYGDIYPITIPGKIIGSVIALLGIGLVAVPTGIISSGFIEVVKENDNEEKKHFCPYCGKKID